MSKNIELSRRIKEHGLQNLQVARDYFDSLRYCLEDDRDYTFAQARVLFDSINRSLGRSVRTSIAEAGKWYDLKRVVCCFLAPESFDHFMQYTEWNREPEKKFWLPRRDVLLPVAHDLEDLEHRVIKFLGVSMPPRVGKLLADDTPVLTRQGWKNHGDLTVGDEVIGESGEFVKVTHVFPKATANRRVWFTDGTYIDAHENHEWKIYNRHRNRFELMETKALENNHETVISGRGHRYHYQLPTLEPLIGEEKPLPVAPYTLGAWLGDGRNTNPDICCDPNDRAVIERIFADGYEMSWSATHKTTGVEYYGFKGLRKSLQSLGMCHSRRRCPKRIPEEYLTASTSQRLELLAGLLDTDGSLIRKEHRYQFTTTDIRLRDDFVALLSTFGWRGSVTEYPPVKSSSGIQGRLTCYSIGFNPTMYIPCVLPRKQLREHSKPRRIAVERVERIEPKRGNCISVEGGLYRVGKSLKLTHNSTLCIFYLAWMMGRHPDDASAMAGHSDTLVNGFYGELNAVLDPNGEYLWHDVFPSVNLESRSAKYMTINLGHAARFPTMTCRSAEGTWTGAVDISKNGILYVDDLVRDLEESLSPMRLDAKYNLYLNTMKDRMKDGAAQLMVGTRWNVLDPLGRIEEQYRDNPDYRFTVIPALDEFGESNFKYDYGVGFSTEYYLDMKNSIDDCTWCAKYMGKPYLREGLVFPPDKLNRYNGVLPDGEPIRKIAYCDVAWGGGDFLSMPIIYVYGDGSMYMVDCVFNAGDKTVTQPLVVGKLKQHLPHQVQFEANNGGSEYANSVDEMLRTDGIHLNISSRKAEGNASKLSRIIQHAPEIQGVHFLDYEHASQEYRKFIEWLTSFVSIGKNVHDDAPDSLAGAMTLLFSRYGVVEVRERPI